jgi:oxaloacetate decarboxylase beta subunit
MSLVPIIMPPVMRLLTTRKERLVRMPYTSRPISRRTRILFPIIVTMVVGTLVPFATPLIGMLMLGNLMRESGVVERLVGASSNELANVVTLFLGWRSGPPWWARALRPATMGDPAAGSRGVRARHGDGVVRQADVCAERR